MALHLWMRGVIPPRTPTPAQTEVTIVGKNEIYRWKNLVGQFLVHSLLGPLPPSPPPPLLILPWGRGVGRGTCML